MKYDGFIFDFDGTVADTSEGILESIGYALEKVGAPKISDEQKFTFIGPSLYSSFTQTVGLSDEDANRAVSAYREYYTPIAVYKCKLYDGMEKLLCDLSKTAKVSIASAKPQPQLEIAVNHLGVNKYASVVIGADLSVKDNDKASQLLRAKQTENSIMIGDSIHDIRSSKSVGMPVVAVAYGFTDYETLAKENPDYIVKSVDELYQLLTK